MRGLTGSILERITSCRPFWRGWWAVRSKWLRAEREVAMLRRQVAMGVGRPTCCRLESCGRVVELWDGGSEDDWEEGFPYLGLGLVHVLTKSTLLLYSKLEG